MEEAVNVVYRGAMRLFAFVFAGIALAVAIMWLVTGTFYYTILLPAPTVVVLLTVMWINLAQDPWRRSRAGRMVGRLRRSG